MRGEPLHPIIARGEASHVDLTDAVCGDVLQVALQEHAAARDLVRIQGGQRGLECCRTMDYRLAFPTGSVCRCDAHRPSAEELGAGACGLREAKSRVPW
jgi:hypothetical protein